MKTAWRDGAGIRTVEIEPGGAGTWRVLLDGSEFEVAVELLSDGRMRLRSDAGSVIAEVTRAGSRRFVRLGALDFVLERENTARARSGGGGHGLTAPMPGVVTRVMVKPGEQVRKGQPLLALEAMKMEHLIRAPHDGRVKSVGPVAGEMVQGGAELVELEDAAGRAGEEA